MIAGGLATRVQEDGFPLSGSGPAGLTQPNPRGAGAAIELFGREM
jgi:hypothetical protein